MFWIGLALWVLVGGELGAVAEGAAGLGDGSGVGPFVTGINLAPWTAIAAAAVLGAGNRKRRGLDVKGPSQRALARVESSRAVSEGPDHLLRLDLSVTPEGGPAFRVETHARVNVMDLERFQPGQTVVADFDVDHPWNVTVSTHPDAAWAGRAAVARIDSVPVESRVTAPRGPRLRSWRYVLPLMAAGFAAYLLLF